MFVLIFRNMQKKKVFLVICDKVKCVYNRGVIYTLTLN